MGKGGYKGFYSLKDDFRMPLRLGKLLEFSGQEPGMLDFLEYMEQSINTHSVFYINLYFPTGYSCEFKLACNFLS